MQTIVVVEKVKMAELWPFDQCYLHLLTMPVVPVIKCILLLQEIHKKKIMYTEAGRYIITLIVDYVEGM